MHFIKIIKKIIRSIIRITHTHTYIQKNACLSLLKIHWMGSDFFRRESTGA